MMDVKKIAGLIGIIATATISTVVTQWMTDREIESRVSEAITEMETRNKEGA